MLSRFVGVPYREGACWDFVRMVSREEFKVDLPCELFTEGWEKVAIPGPGDVVALSDDGSNLVTHVGIMADGERFIHMMSEKAGSTLSKINHMAYKRRIKGFYRWIG